MVGKRRGSSSAMGMLIQSVNPGVRKALVPEEMRSDVKVATNLDGPGPVAYRKTLLGGLFARAGIGAQPAPKKRRGRPRKALPTPQDLADVWDEVTGGEGVLLVDGKEVPPT